MKTLQVPFHYYPEAVGGTEVYVASLVKRLIRKGHEAQIAAPGARCETYRHDGVTVYRYSVSEIRDVSDLYGDGDSLACEQFEQVLDTSVPELVHLHGISPAISLRVLRAIKKRGLPVILTVHIPGILCGRGTLLEHGTDVCDGKIQIGRCSKCVMESKGLNNHLAAILSVLPTTVGRIVKGIGIQSSLSTAVRTTELQNLRIRSLLQFLEEVDHIVVVSEWLKAALLVNGVPAAKLTLCRHGVTQDHADSAAVRRDVSARKRLAYMGRLNPAKGVHILVDAMLATPNLPLELDIYGIVQDDSAYAANLRTRAQVDPRIRFLEPIPNSLIPIRLGEYDALAIPSVWLETGPLTVYDAFAAGIPVVGSRRGGIMELVTHEHDGLLVEAENTTAWSEALDRICAEHGLIERLRDGVRRPRNMNAVAEDMLALYMAFESALHPGPGLLTRTQNS